GQQRLAVARDDGHGPQRASAGGGGLAGAGGRQNPSAGGVKSPSAGGVKSPSAGGVKSRDQAAFGAQGQAVGGVLHVAAGDDVPVGGQAGRADPESGIGSVSTFRRGRGGRAEPWPVDDHVTTLGHAGKGGT